MCVAFGLVILSARQTNAQTRDALLNGAVVGGAVGAAAGVAFTYAVRDSDLTFGQYARGALVFGAIGVGAGVGVDALLNRSPSAIRRPLVITPTVWRELAGVVVNWRW